MRAEPLDVLRRPRETTTREQLADEVRGKLTTSLRCPESLAVQRFRNFPRGFSLLSQIRHPTNKPGEVAQLLIPGYWPNDLMLTGETSVPMDRNIHIFTI